MVENGIPWPSSDINTLQRRRQSEYRRLLAKEIAGVKSGKPMTLAGAERLLTYHDSYSRLPEIIRFAGMMNRRSWLRLLGEYWSILDNLHSWRDMLRLFVPSRTTLLLMNKEERATWHDLPAVVTVYRGCSDINMDGLSWSLCPEVATRFPTLGRYTPPAGHRPLLVTGRVAKSSIAAVKLDRSEQEIIAIQVWQVSVEHLVPGCQSGANLADLES